MQFDFSKPYILENERVLLRPLELEDYLHLKHFAVHEPDLWKYSTLLVQGELGMEQYLRKALAERDAAKDYPFIVFDKRSQQYAGSTRFYDIQTKNGSLQLGYTWYGKAFQGTGLNKQCKYLLLELAFETLGVERVEFKADAQNQKSIAAMLSIGCTHEGILRSHLPLPNGTRRDSAVLSIIKQDWYLTVKALLTSKL